MKKKTVARVIVLVLLSPLWVPVLAIAVGIFICLFGPLALIGLAISTVEWGFTGEWEGPEW